MLLPRVEAHLRQMPLPSRPLPHSPHQQLLVGILLGEGVPHTSLPALGAPLLSQLRVLARA